MGKPEETPYGPWIRLKSDAVIENSPSLEYPPLTCQCGGTVIFAYFPLTIHHMNFEVLFSNVPGYQCQNRECRQITVYSEVEEQLYVHVRIAVEQARGDGGRDKPLKL